MNQATQPAEARPNARPARRQAGTYDDPTPEKIAVGKRLSEARQIAGMTQAEAAEAMGYSQAVQLSLMESGQRMPTVRVLLHCCALYGTTMDFLCGLVDDSDRDPAAAVQREVGARVVGEVRSLVAAVTSGAMAVVRELRPDAGRTARLAAQVVEVAAVLDRMRQLSAEAFDELPAGALLTRRMGEALAVAHEHLAAVARAQRLAGAAPVNPLATAGIELPDTSDVLADLAARLAAPLPTMGDEEPEAGDGVSEPEAAS